MYFGGKDWERSAVLFSDGGWPRHVLTSEDKAWQSGWPRHVLTSEDI